MFLKKCTVLNPWITKRVNFENMCRNKGRWWEDFVAVALLLLHCQLNILLIMLLPPSRVEQRLHDCWFYIFLLPGLFLRAVYIRRSSANICRITQFNLLLLNMTKRRTKLQFVKSEKKERNRFTKPKLLTIGNIL